MVKQAVEIVVDARGHRCPAPTLKLRRALEGAPTGAIVTVLADDPLARIDLPHFAASCGHSLVDLQIKGGVITARVRKG